MKRSLMVLALAACFSQFALAGSRGQQHDEDSPYTGIRIAIGWAVESCKGSELSKGEREACTALGVAGKAENPQDNGYWLPVFLKCPDSNNDGALVSIDENLNGDGRRIIVNYRSNEAESAQTATADTNSNFPEGVTINFNTEPNTKIVDYYEGIVKDISPLNNEICNADSPAAKVRYDQIAKANRITLRAAAPGNFRIRRNFEAVQ